jgi:BRCA1 C Terminus (BRCT) domain
MLPDRIEHLMNLKCVCFQNYNSQKVAAQEAPVPAEQEKENRKAPSVTFSSPSDSPVSKSEPPKRRVFMVTGVQEQDLDHMNMVVTNLGGRMSKLKHFDPEATHLVTSSPSRSEKLLASMAAGLWVIHPQYLLHSSKAGRFLPEEGFEWGNSSAIQHTHSVLVACQRAREMATACHKWRLKAAFHGCAFKNFKAMLLGAPVKTAAFERMIIAGGGEVVPFG